METLLIFYGIFIAYISQGTAGASDVNQQTVKTSSIQVCNNPFMQGIIVEKTVCYTSFWYSCLCPAGHYCCEWSCGMVCCPDDSSCCDSSCCPDNLFCCSLECCGVDNCCINKDGEQVCCEDCCQGRCCDDSESCCDSECCNLEEKACCGPGVGCIDGCPNPFDAVPCDDSFNKPDLETIIVPPILNNATLTLYRVLRPDEDPEKLVPRKPGSAHTMVTHITCGSDKKFMETDGTSFLSFTVHLESAQSWARKDSLRIVKVEAKDLPDSADMTDLSTYEKAVQILGTFKNGQKAVVFASNSKEVLVKCGPGVTIRSRVL